VKTHVPGGVIRPQALHHEGLCLLHHPDIADDDGDDNDDQNDPEYDSAHEISSFLLQE